MGAVTGGSFYGYREEDIGEPLRQRLRPMAGVPPPPQLTPIEVERLSFPTYLYAVFSGEAPDDYPDDWIQVGFMTRMVVITVANAPLDIMVTYDGTTVMQEEVLREGHRDVKAIQGFRVRNTLPGWISWYQIVCLT
jgi:hypothetical protein